MHSVMLILNALHLTGGVVDGSLSAITLVSYGTPIIRLTFDRYANAELEVLYYIADTEQWYENNGKKLDY